MIFSLQPEDLTHVKPCPSFYLPIEIDEAPAHLSGCCLAHGRFSYSRQADQNDVRRHSALSALFCH